MDSIVSFRKSITYITSIITMIRVTTIIKSYNGIQFLIYFYFTEWMDKYLSFWDRLATVDLSMIIIIDYNSIMQQNKDFFTKINNCLSV